MRNRFILIILAAIYPYFTKAQGLTFTQPQNFVVGALSDRAPALTGFNHQYFLAWKGAGGMGNINLAYLGEGPYIPIQQKQITVPGAQSALAPVLLSTADHLYLFWLGADSNVHYIINTGATGFEGALVHTLNLKKPMTFSKGLNAAYVDGRIMLATHTNHKGRLAFVLAEIDDQGICKEAIPTYVKAARSNDYPSVTVIGNGSVARISWVDRSSHGIYFADYTPANNTWLPPQSLTGASADITPTYYGLPQSQSLIMIWQGRKMEGRLNYMKSNEEELPDDKGNVLPEYFTTNLPVALTGLEERRVLMAYTGMDQKLYLSYGIHYNPASWMADLLFPSKENYNLKDIVIPGAHDAGMSVLSGVGGKGGRTINECNTLTQIQNIEKQMNAGIRMFDLRIDTYEGELYAKHAPSDCMEDAIAGGYGEKLSGILGAVKRFLDTHQQEFMLLSFCHFCEKNISLEEQARFIGNALGEDKLFYAGDKTIDEIKLKDLCGKVIVTFENHSFPLLSVHANSMTEGPITTFINYRREYAATNQLNKLLTAQKTFFTRLKGNVHANDIIRLDWQLTEASEEAVFICNDFESEKNNPLVSGAVLLANTVKKNKSIVDLSLMGSRYLPGNVMEWLNDGTINKETKPNIMYVDVAGTWITDFCIKLNQDKLYQK